MQRQKRSTSGHFSFEVALISVLVLIFFAFGFDIVVAVMGFSTLDTAARDAARAAANTSDQKSGLRLAQESALAHHADGFLVTQPTVSNDSKDFSYVTNPNHTDPPSGSPYVVVTTRCQVRMPIPVRFLGGELENGVFLFARTYSYPLLGVPFNVQPETLPIFIGGVEPDSDEANPSARGVLAPEYGSKVETPPIATVTRPVIQRLPYVPLSPPGQAPKAIETP
jgi:hypothetical protein